jgi:hypothetical protein
MRPAIQIIEVREPYGSDFYVYQGDRLIRVCPSIGMAQSVGAGLCPAAPPQSPPQR